MRFDSYIPCNILQPYVQSFAISEAKEENTYKVIPGTGLVIGFQFKGKLSLLEMDKETPLAVAGITGLQDAYRIFKSSPHIGTVLVYFKESGAYHFFKEPLHELFRESISLDHFMLRSELMILEERLNEAKNDRQRIAVVEQFLIARIKHTQPDTLVLQALAIIHKHKGDIRISNLVQQLHTSQSPLEKRFRRVVGTSPKKFASIVRLNYILQLHRAGTSLTATAYEAGYYDQAHFIKEFKTFTGDTPAFYFKNPS